MEGFDVQLCLNSFEILVDSNEQPSQRAFKRYESFGCPYKTQKLDYGDYTYNFTLPNGEPLYEAEKRVYPDVIVERKMDLGELSSCFTGKTDAESKLQGVRNRFEREFVRAKKHGTSIYLLVEDATWENLINGRYNTKFNPAAYFASITAWMARYDIKVIFCKQETSGKIIKEILYRELKERLEMGFYDGLYQD